MIRAEVVRQPGRGAKNNPRFVVSNLTDAPETVYTGYCGRRDVENRLKELQHGLGRDRTSCERFVANQFRVLLTLAACALCQELGGRAAGTASAGAEVTTLRERLLTLTVWVERSVRRIVLQLPARFRWLSTWRRLACAVGATPWPHRALPTCPPKLRGEGNETAASPSEKERVGVRVGVCSRMIRA